MTVPVIDLTAWRDGSDRVRVAEAVGKACREIGFLVITGHGVPDAVIEQARGAALDFFRLPDERKCRWQAHDDAYRGYVPLLSEALSASLDNQSPPDLKESYNMGPVDPAPAGMSAEHTKRFFAPNFWPTGRRAWIRPGAGGLLPRHGDACA